MSMTSTLSSLSAGTCVKIGFFGALGAFLFGLIVTVILAIVSLILGLIFGSSIIELLRSSTG